MVRVSFRIGYDAAQLAHVVDTLTDLRDRGDDLTPLWPKIGDWFAERQRAVWDRGRSAWKPLDADYLIANRRSGFAGRGPLIRTGALKRAVSKGTPVKQTPSYAVFGAKGGPAWYGVFHQRGTTVMPKRQPVPKLTATERREVVTLVADYLLGR